MSGKDKPAPVIPITKAAENADARQHEKREAKARELKNRFSAARKANASKSRAAERLKKLFKQPRKSSPK